MIVDGKGIAERVIQETKKRVSLLTRQPRMAIISMAESKVTESYLSIKRDIAVRVGVELSHHVQPETATTEDIVRAIVACGKTADSIVLQLPFPAHIKLQTLLGELPQSKDPDCIGVEASASFARGDSSILPPVIAAIEEIARVHAYDFKGKRVVVIGQGRLVGSPAALWLRQQGAEVTVVTKDDSLKPSPLSTADVLVLGAGSPGLVTPEMIKQGVVIFDAGTSEEGGRVVGDADPRCIESASLITPVPGGIGPVAVAKLFENTLTLLEWHDGSVR